MTYVSVKSVNKYKKFTVFLNEVIIYFFTPRISISFSCAFLRSWQAQNFAQSTRTKEI